jgi:hypothetical protein
MVPRLRTPVYRGATVPVRSRRPSEGVLMPEPHYLASGDAGTGVDDHFFRRYRELLDAEDNAFDELEHAYEDGDRAHFEADLVSWRSAHEQRMSFLERRGFTGSPLVL